MNDICPICGIILDENGFCSKCVKKITQWSRSLDSILSTTTDKFRCQSG